MVKSQRLDLPCHFRKKVPWFSQSWQSFVFVCFAVFSWSIILYFCSPAIIFELIRFVQISCRNWIQRYPWRSHLWQVLGVWAPFGVKLSSRLPSSQLHQCHAMAVQFKNIMFLLLKCLPLPMCQVTLLPWYPAPAWCLLDAQEILFRLMIRCRLATPWRARTLST
jgi:hypothetical protein